MRIAVIADTHNKLPQSVLHEIIEADEIWHLGDVVDESILVNVRALGRPLLIVRGNCDHCPHWPLEEKITRCGKEILLVHIPPRVPPPGIDILLHGHTHVSRKEMVGETLYLNPGCITRPNRGAPASYAWLELKPGAEPHWQLKRLS